MTTDEQPARPTPPPVAEERVAVAPAGTICRRCFYGLRGLPVNGHCTECNTPVKSGLSPAWWANAPVALLDTFAARAGLAALATVLGLTVSAASLLFRDDLRQQVNQTTVAQVVFSVTWTAASLAQAVLIARCMNTGRAVSSRTSLLLAVALWGSAVVATAASYNGVTRWIVNPPQMTLLLWNAILTAPLRPVWFMSLGAAIVACASHFGSAGPNGPWLKRLGIVLIVAGAVNLALVIPQMIVYATYLSGTLSFGQPGLSDLSQITGSILDWFWIAPGLLLPTLLWMLGAAVRRAAEARRAGA